MLFVVKFEFGIIFVRVFSALLKISFYIFCSAVPKALAFEVFEIVWFVEVVVEGLGWVVVDMLLSEVVVLDAFVVNFVMVVNTLLKNYFSFAC